MNFCSKCQVKNNSKTFSKKNKRKTFSPISTKITVELVQIFEQYFIATQEEVERFKKKGDPISVAFAPGFVEAEQSKAKLYAFA